MADQPSLQGVPTFNRFDIVKTGMFDVRGTNMATGTTATTTVPHNLGYIPAIHIYVDAVAIAALQGGNGLTNLPLSYFIVPSAVLFSIQCRVDDTNLYIDFFNPSSGSVDITDYTWHFQYYLMRPMGSS